MANILSFLTPKSETLYLKINSTIRQTLERFDYYKYSVVPLLDDEGKYVTTISEGDILRYIKNDAYFDIRIAESVKVGNIEKYRPYKALTIFSSFEEVIKLSLEQNFIPIIDDRGVYIGIIKRKSIIDFLVKNVNVTI